MSTLNYIDENNELHKFGVIPSNYIRKVDELETGVLVAEASANQTFASQLGTLYTSYNALTEIQKRRCFILFTQASGDTLIPITGLADGSGMVLSLSSSAQSSIMFNIKFSLHRISTLSGSTLTIQDRSGDTNNYPLRLYMR